MILAFMFNPWLCYGCLAMYCMGSKGAYMTLCSNETIEYGIKDAKSHEVLYTFQNDKTGCEKVCCCGLGVPQEDKCANCDALTNMNMFRNAHRTIFDGFSKDGSSIIEGNAPGVGRQAVASITRTTTMMPVMMCPHVCCCAAETYGGEMGSMQVTHAPDRNAANQD